MFRETDPLPAGGGSSVRAAQAGSAARAAPARSFAVDLGGRVALRDWLRGTATLYGAIAALIAISPGVVPLPVLPRVHAISAPKASAPPPIPRSDRIMAVPALPVRMEPGHGPLRIAGPVGFSLYRAARLSGIPLAVVAEYLRAIGPRVDVGDIRATDRFDIVMQPADAGGRSRLLLAGLVHDGRRMDLVRDGDDWFDADGAGPHRESGFALPVYGRATSSFGMRMHPVLGFGRMHQGVDLAAAIGSPIVAASDGTVRYAGWHGGHGNYVLIDHDAALATGYGHMSRIVATPGARVRRGELIGYVGATGLATGPHLHFEVWRGGVAVDPATASFATTRRASAAAVLRVRATIARLTAMPARAAAVVASR